jgi:hypothetical protein
VNPKSPRTRFVASLTLYLLWLGTLVALAIVSANPPAALGSRSASAAAAASPEPPTK